MCTAMVKFTISTFKILKNIKYLELINTEATNLFIIIPRQLYSCQNGIECLTPSVRLRSGRKMARAISTKLGRCIPGPWHDLILKSKDQRWH